MGAGRKALISNSITAKKKKKKKREREKNLSNLFFE
jgi:hypothetical protein